MTTTHDTELRWNRPGPGAWSFDAAHNVGPVTPVIQSIYPDAMAAGFRSFTGRYGVPLSHIEIRYVHGYTYGAARIAGVHPTDLPPPPPPVMRVLSRVHPEMRRRNRAAVRAMAERIWRDDLERWFGQLRPARLASVRALQAVDPTALDDAELAEHLDACIAQLSAGLEEHFSLVGASGLPVGVHLLREQRRGRDSNEALRDLQGAAAASTAATLTALAEVATALAQTGAVPTDLAQVRVASPAAAAALDAYLDDYGQRVVGAFDVTGRRLVEMPDVVLRSIAAAARHVEQNAPTVDPDDVVLADAVLALASRDDHAGISCMWPLGLLRRALLAVGERLHTDGRLHSSHHVLEADPQELRDLLSGSSTPSADTLAARAAERRQLGEVEPPAALGVVHPPPDPSVFPSGLRAVSQAMGAFLSTLEGTAGAEADGAAIGIGDRPFRGRAVVAARPEDAIERLRPGDVLITTTTTPAFNCILPIAGALVTAHGGAMSHAGIAARELGIVAVLGARDALERIADGSEVVVDPVAATVDAAPLHVGFGPDVATAPVEAERVGGKAAGLIEMSALGLTVPPGVVIPVGVTPSDLDDVVRDALADLERRTGRRLGDPAAPLLVSVRSGAAVSMPGMMDTLLDVGATPDVVAALARSSGDDEFAADTRRRFLQGWAEAVGGTPPEDPVEQVVAAARAVVESWHSERARVFRDREGIDHGGGTAVTIQSMVFGNLDGDSGTGVVFSRDPSTGGPGLVGDLIVGAQGDDVVSGTHTTLPIDALDRWPEVQRELIEAIAVLERHHADMVDVEFTVERGQLHLLQCRPGRRSDAAALRIAVDLARDPAVAVDRAEAVRRCRHLLDRASWGDVTIDPTSSAERDVVARGLAASPGSGTGALVVSVEDALRRHDAGEEVVLARPSTSPADVAAMSVATGVITSSGGIVSHAAVVARSWNLPAVVGADQLQITGTGIRTGDREIPVGSIVTVDGTTGELLVGAHDGAADAPPELAELRTWAEELAGATSDPVDPSDTAPAEQEPFERVDPAALTSDELDVLGTVVLRHRVELADLAAAIRLPDDMAVVVEHLSSQQLVEQRGTSVTATAAGRVVIAERTAQLTEHHRQVFADLLERFAAPDRALKAIVTQQQLAAPPEQADGPSVLEQLHAQVHLPVGSIIDDAATTAPHLARYRDRFDRALTELWSGDERYLASPSVDSYHGIWFELHEELIALSGATRDEHDAAT